MLAALGSCLLSALPDSAALAVPITTDQIGVKVEPQVSPELEAAVKEFNQQHFDKALELLNSAAEKNPELPPGRTTLARFFLQANQIPVARAMIEQAVLEQPEDPEAYRMLGDIAFSERRMTESRLVFEELARRAEKFSGNPKRKSNYITAAHAGLAAVAEAQQQWEVARQHLTAWLALDPKNAGAHHRMGQALFGLEKPDEAYRELQTAAAAVPELPAPEVTMGRLYQQAGNEEQAAEWMKQAIAKSPDSLTARLGVAQWEWERGELEAAQQNVDAALKLKADSLEAQVLAGLIHRFQKNYAAAEQNLQAAYLAAPNNAMAANQLALVLIEQADEAKKRRAIELAEHNSRQFGNNPEVAATLGWIYFQNGRAEDAAKIFKVVANAGRVSPDTAYFMARLANQAGQGSDALPALRSALESRSPFAYRDEASKLLAEIEASPGGAAQPTESKPDGAPRPADPATAPKPAGKAPAPRSAPTRPSAGAKVPAAPKPASGSKAPAKAQPAPAKAGGN
ncbi:MAG: tetratricopeptide repeat protein [Planctomycetaceae bacterium]|nr:tetratricopeptide repeat protein [Planctomycetaceae bacterium]